jgi:hypothetical protein
LPKTAVLILQCEVSCCHARRTSSSFQKTEDFAYRFCASNETVLQYHISLSTLWPGGTHSLWMILWLSRNVTNITSFYVLKLKFCICWRAWWAPFHALSFCLGIIQKLPVLITCYSWVTQGMIIIHRLNKLLACLQSESLFFSLIKQSRTNPVQISVFQYLPLGIYKLFSANFYFLFHHPKLLTISWNQFPNCFSQVVFERLFVSTVSVLFDILTAILKSCIKKPMYGIKRYHCKHVFLGWKFLYPFCLSWNKI